MNKKMKKEKKKRWEKCNMKYLQHGLKRHRKRFQEIDAIAINYHKKGSV